MRLAYDLDFHNTIIELESYLMQLTSQINFQTDLKKKLQPQQDVVII